MRLRRTGQDASVLQPDYSPDFVRAVSGRFHPPFDAPIPSDPSCQAGGRRRACNRRPSGRRRTAGHRRESGDQDHLRGPVAGQNGGRGRAVMRKNGCENSR